MSSQFIKCPACSQLVKFKSFRIRPELKYNDRHFYFAKCDNCGHIRQYPLRAPSVYKHLGYHTQNNYEEHCKNRAKYIFEFLGIKHIILRYNEPFRILDLGSGQGGVGHFLQLEILNFIALDIIEKNGSITANQLSRNIDLVQVTGVTYQQEENTYIKTEYLNLDDKQDLDKLAMNKYDLIIMSHTLEHLMHPETIIDYIDRCLLDTNGLLYIEVPSLYTRGIRMGDTFIPHHISYFTKTSLTNLIQINSGLREIKTRQSNYWGSIKTLYIKLQMNYQVESYNKEKFVEIKYWLSQVKNKVNKLRVKYLHKKPRNNE